jgi:hypothetical protein
MSRSYRLVLAVLVSAFCWATVPGMMPAQAMDPDRLIEEQRLPSSLDTLGRLDDELHDIYSIHNTDYDPKVAERKIASIVKLLTTGTITMILRINHLYR